MRTKFVLIASVVGVVGFCFVVWKLVGRPSAPPAPSASSSEDSSESSSTAPPRRLPAPARGDPPIGKPSPAPAKTAIPVEAEVRTSKLLGRITRGDDGTPLAQRDVQIVARLVGAGEEVAGGDRTVMAFAGSDGSFAFKKLEAGLYELWVHSNNPALRDVRRRVAVGPSHPETPVDIVLPRSSVGHLRLRVFEPDGKPTEDVTVCVMEDLGDGRMRGTTVKARPVGDGVLEIALEAGERRVTAFRPGFRSDPPILQLTIEEGATVDREIRLQVETRKGRR